MSAPIADRIASVLRGHEDYGLYWEYGGDTHYVCECDKEKRPGTHRAHLAAVLAPLVEEAAQEAADAALAPVEAVLADEWADEPPSPTYPEGRRLYRWPMGVRNDLLNALRAGREASRG